MGERRETDDFTFIEATITSVISASPAHIRRFFLKFTRDHRIFDGEPAFNVVRTGIVNSA